MSSLFLFSFRGSYNCTNVISTDEGKTVSLYFRNFHLADSVNCTLNYLEIRDGQTGTDPLLARLCSRYKNQSYICSSNRKSMCLSVCVLKDQAITEPIWLSSNYVLLLGKKDWKFFFHIIQRKVSSKQNKS